MLQSDWSEPKERRSHKPKVAGSSQPRYWYYPHSSIPANAVLLTNLKCNCTRNSAPESNYFQAPFLIRSLVCCTTGKTGPFGTRPLRFQGSILTVPQNCR